MRLEDKYIKMVKKVIENTNVIVYVGDARYPRVSISPSLLSHVKAHRPVVVALNKADLVPRKVTAKWENHFRKQGYGCVAVSAKDRLQTGALRLELATTAGKHGFKQAVDLGVMGLPNVGKSSLINIIHGRHSASVSSVPGHTKAVQKLKVTDKMMVWDTPGITEMGEALEESDALLMGTTPVEELHDIFSSAELLADRLHAINPKAFKASLPCDWEGGAKLVEFYGNRYGKLVKGGHRDLESGVSMFLHDYMKGKFTCWEKPPA